MKSLIKLLPLLCLPFTTIAKEKTYGNLSSPKIVSIYDGDTFTITVPKWPSIIGENVNIRIDSIDCPEMKDKRDSIKSLAKTAKKFTSDKLKSGKIITLKNMKRDKYFRILATVYIDGFNLADSLKILGLAKGYNGGTKESW